MSVTYPLRLDEDLDAEVRAIAAKSGQSVNRELNNLIRAGMEARRTDDSARAKLRDRNWLTNFVSQVRQSDGEILELLSR